MRIFADLGPDLLLCSYIRELAYQEVHIKTLKLLKITNQANPSISSSCKSSLIYSGTSSTLMIKLFGPRLPKFLLFPWFA